MPPGEVAAELARLSRSVELLEQGLSQMLDTMATHTELLSKLLIAATADTKPEQDLAVVLKGVGARLAENQVALRGVERAMVELPGHVGQAVATEMANALAAVR
jgi:hypothetical protein